jgi:hypothetical protein
VRRFRSRYGRDRDALRFDLTDAGFVNVTLDEELPVLSDALEDSLGTRPPRAAPQDGPSTYWLDNGIARLRERMESGTAEPFASGNATYLQLQEGLVEARYDYDPPDSDVISAVAADEFLALLVEWRRRVVEVSPDAVRRMPPPSVGRPMPRPV